MGFLKVGSGGVPVGNYIATFAGVEDQAPNTEKGYGAGLRWKFSIAEGSLVGQTASRITGQMPTPKNACGKILSGLLGKGLAEGQEVDPSQFIGRRYHILVGQGQAGTRVEAVIAA